MAAAQCCCWPPVPPPTPSVWAPSNGRNGAAAGRRRPGGGKPVRVVGGGARGVGRAAVPGVRAVRRDGEPRRPREPAGRGHVGPRDDHRVHGPPRVAALRAAGGAAALREPERAPRREPELPRRLGRLLLAPRRPRRRRHHGRRRGGRARGGGGGLPRAARERHRAGGRGGPRRVFFLFLSRGADVGGGSPDARRLRLGSGHVQRLYVQVPKAKGRALEFGAVGPGGMCRSSRSSPAQGWGAGWSAAGERRGAGASSRCWWWRGGRAASRVCLRSKGCVTQRTRGGILRLASADS